MTDYNVEQIFDGLLPDDPTERAELVEELASRLHSQQTAAASDTASEDAPPGAASGTSDADEPSEAEEPKFSSVGDYLKAATAATAAGVKPPTLRSRSETEVVTVRGYFLSKMAQRAAERGDANA